MAGSGALNFSQKLQLETVRLFRQSYPQKRAWIRPNDGVLEVAEIGVIWTESSGDDHALVVAALGQGSGPFRSFKQWAFDPSDPPCHHLAVEQAAAYLLSPHKP